MKKLLILLLVFIPLMVFSQTIHTKDIVLTVQTFAEIGEVNFNGSYHYFYDDDDNIVMQGAFTCNDSKSKTSYGVPVKASYKSSANFDHGKLDGVIDIYYDENISYQGQTGKGVYKLKGQYNKGVMTGDWTIETEARVNGQGAKDIYSIKFSEGELLSYTHYSISSKGEKSVFCDLNINSDKTLSGLIDESHYDNYNKMEYHFSNGIITNYFIRKTGEKSIPEEKEKDIINKLISGEIENKDLIEKGYFLKEIKLSSLNGNSMYTDLINYTFQQGAMKYYLVGEKIISLYDILANKLFYIPKDYNKILYALEKIQFGTYEEAVKIIDNGYPEYYDEYLTLIQNDYCIIDNNYKKIYLDKDVREKTTQYINEKKRLAEEKRKREEQLAEEKRKEQARLAEEKRKKEEQIQEFQNTISTLKSKNKKYSDLFFTTQYYQGSYVTVTNLGYGKQGKTYEVITKELELDRYLSSRTPEYFSAKDWEGYSKIKTFFNVFDRYYMGGLLDSLESTAKAIKSEAEKDCKDVAQSYLNSYDFKIKSFATYNELINHVNLCDKEKIKQQECLQFIKARKVILSNHTTIEERCKTAKNIKKVYEEYYNNFDKAWTNESKVNKLQPLIDLQEQLKTGLLNPQIKEIDEQIKKNKTNNIQEIITLINKK